MVRASPAGVMRAGRGLACLLGLLLGAGVVYAHERFIRHDLKFPLKEEYFRRHPATFLGIEPNMLRIATTCCVLLVAFLALFFFRQNLDIVVEHRLLSFLRGAPQRFVHHAGNFLMDRPVRLPWFHALGEWAVILFIRSPALVLMFSATNDSLVMPSYSLEPLLVQFSAVLNPLFPSKDLTQHCSPSSRASQAQISAI